MSLNDYAPTTRHSGKRRAPLEELRTKKLPNPLGTDSHVNLIELASGHKEERDARFARHRPGEQGLARAGRAGKKHALGQLAAAGIELCRVLQELNNLLQLALGLVHALHVSKLDHFSPARLKFGLCRSSPEQAGVLQA
ncbi:MAG: hypothetical protein BJ554DRAFT_5940 [Olpidium bornovanus]|uniref:Uncharacterized protein n=1 Tax=Olpidium bornovanus TaxID=278681 RepID=A0A8H8DL31_9FUNG|nr:MAG: hypothetical protein BJ554DRAFT_5940 [Olpidium bornovanus]